MKTYTVQTELVVRNRQKIIYILYLDNEPKDFTGTLEIDGKEYECNFVYDAPKAFTIHSDSDTMSFIGKTVVFK